MVRVTRVKPVRAYVLRLWFNTGETGLFDVAPYLDGPVFEPLRDKEFFRRVAVDHTAGTICWPNGADFCPDVLHDESIDAPDEAHAGRPAK